MNLAVIVTGATGFLGSHLVAGILGKEAEVTAICLARSTPGRPARQRVLQAVGRAYRDRGGNDEPPGWEERVVVLEGDLVAGEVVSEEAAEVLRRAFQINEFWHCAASIEFRGERGSAVWQTNIDGLRQALAVADRLGSLTFNHVSTAYVAGKNTGRIPETVDSRPRAYNNVYEESKHLGEEMVVQHCLMSKMAYRVFRPSIIVGHSHTRCSSCDSGLYQAVDLIRGFIDGVRAKSPDYFDRETLKLCINREATLNVIPVDIVVAEMLDLASLGSRTFGEVFHITSESPVGVYDAFRVVLELAGVQRYEVVGPEAELGVVDRVLNRALRFYNPYLDHRKIFERGNVVRHGADRHQLGYLLDLDRLRGFIGYYMNTRRAASTAAGVGPVEVEAGLGQSSVQEVMVP